MPSWINSLASFFGYIIKLFKSKTSRANSKVDRDSINITLGSKNTGNTISISTRTEEK